MATVLKTSKEKKDRDDGKTSLWKTLLVPGLPTLTAVALSLGLWLLFSANGGPSPGTRVSAWANVWVVFMYVPAMAAVLWSVKREGVAFRDLFGFEHAKLLRDSLLGVGMTFVFWVSLTAATFAASALVFGLFGNPFQGGEMGRLAYPDGLVFVVFSLLLLPLAAGVCEEVIYRGYAFPRIETVAGKVSAVLLTALFYGVQHVGIALFADWRYALMRGVSLFLVGVVLAFIYQRQRRLLPLIVGHVIIDVIGLGLPAVLAS